MKTIIIFVITLLFTSVGFSQTPPVDQNSTGEISESVLTPTQLAFHHQKLNENKEMIESQRLCYGVYDDSGTYCRTGGIIPNTDQNVNGRQWGVIYVCGTSVIVTYWPL